MGSRIYTSVDKFLVFFMSFTLVGIFYGLILYSINAYFFYKLKESKDPDLNTTRIESGVALNGLLAALFFVLLIMDSFALYIYMKDIKGGEGKIEITGLGGLGSPYQKAQKILQSQSKKIRTDVLNASGKVINRERRIIKAMTEREGEVYYVVDGCSNIPGSQGIYARRIAPVDFNEQEIVYNNFNPNTGFIGGILPNAPTEILPNDSLVKVYLGSQGFQNAKIQSLGVCGSDEKLVLPIPEIERLEREEKQKINVPVYARKSTGIQGPSFSLEVPYTDSSKPTYSNNPNAPAISGSVPLMY